MAASSCAAARPRSGAGRAPAVADAERAFRFWLGFCLGWLVRIWVATLRVRVEVPESFVEDRGRALAFFHGHQMALLAARGFARGAVLLVSRSRDGDVSAGVMTALGFRVVRGSSSRGGAPAFASLVRAVRRGETVAVSVDGPRGPRHVAKPGVVAAATAGRVPLYPLASAAGRSWTLTRTWDRFEIPLPFSTIAVVVGPAASAAEARADPVRLVAAVLRCRRRAEHLLRSEAQAPRGTASSPDDEAPARGEVAVGEAGP